MELPPSLRERYEDLGVLGAGGFGAVLRCRDRRLGRELALKLLRAADDPEVVARFQREARVTAALKHPNVVEVFDHGVADEVPWIAYGFVEGRDLDAWRRAHGRPSAELLRAWAAQAAEALAVVHDAGLVHRDVKPANLMVRDSDDGLVLVDFGISRAAVRPADTLHTQEGLILGTPAYMAPELFRGLPPSPASDQWGLAAVLAELSCGVPPYRAHTPTGVIAAARDYSPADVPIPGAAGKVLRRALSSIPEDRYPGLRSMAAALEEAPLELSDPVVARPARDASPTLRQGEPATRRPAPFLVALGLVGLGLLAAAAWHRGRPADPPRPPPPEPSRAAPADPLPGLLEEVRAAERELRRVATDGAGQVPWDLDPHWEGDYQSKRSRHRRVFYDSSLVQRWATLAERLADLLEVLDREPAPRRRELFPELYAHAQLVGMVELLATRGYGLAGDKMDDVFRQGIDLKSLTLSHRRTEKIRATFQEILAAYDALGRRLLAIPDRSRTLEVFARFVALLSRRGDVPARYRAAVEAGPAPIQEQEEVLITSITGMLYQDPRFFHWENDRSLDAAAACALLPQVRADLAERVSALPGPAYRAAMSCRLARIELQAAVDCSPGPPVRELVQQIEGLVERIEPYHRDDRDLVGNLPQLRDQARETLGTLRDEGTPGWDQLAELLERLGVSL